MLRLFFSRWRRLLLVPLLLVPLLQGCVRSDLTLRFDHHTHGQIVQSLALTPRAQALGGVALEDWLTTATATARQLGGQVRHPDRTHWQFTIPFTTGPDLQQRLDQLFAPTAEGTLPLPTAPALTPDLVLEQQHRGLAVRTHLRLTLDLRLLPVPPNPTAPTQTTDWLNLTFSVAAPWGLVSTPDPLEPDASTLAPLVPIRQTPGHTAWVLTPGQINLIDATFWLPSWPGLGGLAIALAVLAGYGVRYGLLGAPRAKG